MPKRVRRERRLVVTRQVAYQTVANNLAPAHGEVGCAARAAVVCA
jgi:hypothetical protein